MQPLRTIVQFFFVSLIVYLALVLVPWPGVRQGYRSLYIATIHGVYGRFGKEGRVHCEPRDIDALEDLDLYLGNRVGDAPVAVSTARLGYAPLAFLVALAVAAPVPWRRKWRSLVLGLIFVEAFVVLRSGLLIAYWFGSPGPIRLYTPGPVGGWIIAKAYELLALSPGASFVVPTLVWAAISWRMEDVRRMLDNLRFPGSRSPER